MAICMYIDLLGFIPVEGGKVSGLLHNLKSAGRFLPSPCAARVGRPPPGVLPACRPDSPKPNSVGCQIESRRVNKNKTFEFRVPVNVYQMYIATKFFMEPHRKCSRLQTRFTENDFHSAMSSCTDVRTG